MSQQPVALRTRLRAIDPVIARLQTDVIASLHGREVAEMRTTARSATARDLHAAAGWILFESRRGSIGVAPLLADGALARMTGEHGQPDAAVASATLAAIEPLIAAVETLLRLELRPVALSDGVDETHLPFRIDGLQPHGPIRHRLLLAVPPDFAIDSAPPPPVALEALTDIALRWRGAIDGPSIAHKRLMTVEAGDLLLLGNGPLTARLFLPGRATPWRAHIDPIAREARVVSETIQGETQVWNRDEQRRDEPLEDSQVLPAADIKVPIRIEFDGGSIQASQLAAIAPGSVLPLPAEGAVLKVRLVAGESHWAEGELVAVGDGYGVLIGAIRGRAD